MIQNKPITRSWLFGAVEYERVALVAVTYLFTFPVYRRAGDRKWLLGFVWGGKG